MKNICSDCSPHTFPPFFVGAADVVALRFHLARESLTGEEHRGGAGKWLCGGDAKGLCSLGLAGVGLRGSDAEGLRGRTGVGLRGDDAKGLPSGAAKGLPAARRASPVRSLRAGEASCSRGLFFFFYMSRPVLVGCFGEL
jgi:hypothetical protein